MPGDARAPRAEMKAVLDAKTISRSRDFSDLLADRSQIRREIAA